MNELLLGAIAACSFIAALFFLRFWKTTKDKFFLFFALSFLIEGANRVSLVAFFDLMEGSPIYYFIRFISYAFIIFAIMEKNKRHQLKKTTTTE
jgi:hypothetical protein